MQDQLITNLQKDFYNQIKAQMPTEAMFNELKYITWKTIWRQLDDQLMATLFKQLQNEFVKKLT